MKLRWFKLVDWVDDRIFRHRWDSVCFYVSNGWLKAEGKQTYGADYYDDGEGS